MSRTTLTLAGVPDGRTTVAEWSAQLVSCRLKTHCYGAVGAGGDEAVWAARLQAAHRQQRRHGALVHARQLGIHLHGSASCLQTGEAQVEELM